MWIMVRFCGRLGGPSGNSFMLAACNLTNAGSEVFPGNPHRGALRSTMKLLLKIEDLEPRRVACFVV